MNEIEPSDDVNPFSLAGHQEGEIDATAQRKRIWTCFVYPTAGIGLAIAVQVVVVVALMFGMLVDGGDAKEAGDKIVDMLVRPDLFVLTIVLSQLCLAVFAFAPWIFTKERFAYRYQLCSFPEPLKVYSYTLASSIFVLALSIGLVYLVAIVIPPDESVKKFYDAVTPGWGILFVIVIALMPGFIEEALFRGYVQRRFMARWSPALSIGVASLIFALAHITPHGIAVALPLGIWFGIISWRVGSIWPTIACHAFVNGGLNTWRLVCKFAEIDAATANYFHIAFVVIGLIGFVLTCRLLFSKEFQKKKLALSGQELVA